MTSAGPAGRSWPEAAQLAGSDRPHRGQRRPASNHPARLARPGRAVWANRPWWARLAAGSVVPPPGVLPALFLLGVGACVAPGLRWRALGATVAIAAGLFWLLAATAWVRISTGGVLWRHLGTVRRLPWEDVTGCATVWVEQGRKQVRVVGFETSDGRLELLWPTAWVGEANRRAVVAVVGRYRFGPAAKPAAH